jgi:hypothetical protein
MDFGLTEFPVKRMLLGFLKMCPAMQFCGWVTGARRYSRVVTAQRLNCGFKNFRFGVGEVKKG